MSGAAPSGEQFDLRFGDQGDTIVEVSGGVHRSGRRPAVLVAADPAAHFDDGPSLRRKGPGRPNSVSINSMPRPASILYRVAVRGALALTGDPSSGLDSGW